MRGRQRRENVSLDNAIFAEDALARLIAQHLFGETHWPRHLRASRYILLRLADSGAYDEGSGEQEIQREDLRVLRDGDGHDG